MMSSELRASGVDFSFAPVVDLARGNAAIGPRAFHADPASHRRAGAGLRARHAPGRHGGGAQALPRAWFGGRRYPQGRWRSTRDSSTRSAATTCCRSSKASSARVEAVMMAHVIYPAVDDRPAGYSKRWIEQILRGELGFNGAVISDDISMAAAGAAGSVGERVQAHLDAGCDLVLACFPDVVEEAHRRHRRPRRHRSPATGRFARRRRHRPGTALPITRSATVSSRASRRSIPWQDNPWKGRHEHKYDPRWPPHWPKPSCCSIATHWNR